MKRIGIHIIFFVFFIISCKPMNQMEIWKQEIIDTEKAFASKAKADGIEAAFMAYAADDAVLMRGNKLVKGKTQLLSYFKQNTSEGEELVWSPDFVDVSASGDMAYTYGSYTYTGTDASGQKVVSTGIFHTVWKRQADKSWKFVWD